MVCHSLASNPAVKGKGVGTEMVLYCIECAKKQGYQSIRLDVVPDNIPAKRLYELVFINSKKVIAKLF